MKTISALFLLLAILSEATQAKVLDKIEAIVNSEIITHSDFEQYKRGLKEGQVADPVLLRGLKPQEVAKDREKVLQYIIDEKIIDSAVKHSGLEMPMEAVEKEIRQQLQQNNMTKQQLQQLLKQQGMSYAEYQDAVKTQLARNALIHRTVNSQIKISDRDIERYYLNNKASPAEKAFKYTLSHIAFPKSAGPQKARQGAERALQQFESGKSFEELVAKHSQDEEFGDAGLLGTFQAGELNKDLEQSVAPLKEGGVSPVIETASSFYVIKVLKKQLVANPQLEKERERIRNILYAQAFKDQFKFWLNKEREDAFIRLNP